MPTIEARVNSPVMRKRESGSAVSLRTFAAAPEA